MPRDIRVRFGHDEHRLAAYLERGKAKPGSELLRLANIGLSIDRLCAVMESLDNAGLALGPVISALTHLEEVGLFMGGRRNGKEERPHAPFPVAESSDQTWEAHNECAQGPSIPPPVLVEGMGDQAEAQPRTSESKRQIPVAPHASSPTSAMPSCEFGQGTEMVEQEVEIDDVSVPKFSQLWSCISEHVADAKSGPT